MTPPPRLPPRPAPDSSGSRFLPLSALQPPARSQAASPPLPAPPAGPLRRLRSAAVHAEAPSPPRGNSVRRRREYRQVRLHAPEGLGRERPPKRMWPSGCARGMAGVVVLAESGAGTAGRRPATLLGTGRRGSLRSAESGPGGRGARLEARAGSVSRGVEWRTWNYTSQGSVRLPPRQAAVQRRRLTWDSAGGGAGLKRDAKPGDAPPRAALMHTCAAAISSSGCSRPQRQKAAEKGKKE